MKQIPNLFTLLNLIFGCIAIVFMLQTGETIVAMDENGVTQIMLPEKFALGALFLFGAAIIDFLDGFIARLFKATSAMGEQLDSLSDVVSFGVAPGVILYQLLRMSFAQQLNGLDVSFYVLLPAFIYTAAAAWRLAKFNISTDQIHSFRGIPSPAAGLLIASFPLILNLGHPVFSIQSLLLNKYIIYLVILIVSYLMVCNNRFMAMKFKTYSIKDNMLKYTLVLISVAAIIFLKWLAIPLIFILYIILSFIVKEPELSLTNKKQTLDLTV